MELKDTVGRCSSCPDARIISAGNWEFVGCRHDPYRGKWVAEIKECPKVQQATVEIDVKKQEEAELYKTINNLVNWE